MACISVDERRPFAPSTGTGPWGVKNKERLIRHSDKGSQKLSVCCTERLAGTGIAAFVGSTGDAYDKALGEMINYLYKTKVI